MKQNTLKLFAGFMLAAVCLVSQAAGIDVMSFVSPDAAMGLTLAGAALTTTFHQKGHTLNLAPTANVASGVGHMFGAGLFGVALTNAVNAVASSFITEGVVTIAKTDALAIAVGDRVFWDATNKVVNKTAAAQVCVGVCVEAVAVTAGLVTCKIKLGRYLAPAT